MTQTLAQKLDDVFQQNPEKIAMVSPYGQELTYGAMHALVQAFAENIKLSGADQPGFIAPVVGNVSVNLILRLACAYLGLSTVMTQNPKAAKGSGVPIKWVITDKEVPVATPGVIRFDKSWMRQPYSRVLPVEGFTAVNGSSGTTGEPKYMMGDPGTLLSRLKVELKRPEGSDGAFLFGYGQAAGIGFMFPLIALLGGGTIVFEAETPAETLARMKKYKVSRIMVPLQQLGTLLDEAWVSDTAVPSLKLIFSGGSAMSRKLATACEAQFDCKVVNTYGSSEIGRIAEGEPSKSDVEIGCVGKPVDNVEIKFVDVDGSEAKPEIGGELLIRVPEDQRIKAVFNAALPYDTDGFARPGDVGYMSESGELILTGRSKDIINVGGNKIAPIVIESIALKCKGVKEAIALSVTGDKGLENVGLAIVTEEGFRLGQLEASFADANLSKYLIHPIVVDQMPVTPARKIDKGALRMMFERDS